MSVYIGPVQKCTSPLTELDEHGVHWGFSECAEVVSDSGDLKELHAAACQVSPYVKWFATLPVPHYRITRKCRWAAYKSGTFQTVGQDVFEKIVEKMVVGH